MAGWVESVSGGCGGASKRRDLVVPADPPSHLGKTAQKDGSTPNLNVNPSIPTQTGVYSHMQKSFIICSCIRKLCAAKAGYVLLKTVVYPSSIGLVWCRACLILSVSDTERA